MFRTQDAEQFRILYDKTRAIGKKIEADYKSLGNCTDAQKLLLKQIQSEMQAAEAENIRLKTELKNANQKFEICLQTTTDQLNQIKRIKELISSINNTLYGGLKVNVLDTKTLTKEGSFPTVKELDVVSENITKIGKDVNVLKNRFSEVNKKRIELSKPKLQSTTAWFFDLLGNFSG